MSSLPGGASTSARVRALATMGVLLMAAALASCEGKKAGTDSTSARTAMSKQGPDDLDALDPDEAVSDSGPQNPNDLTTLRGQLDNDTTYYKAHPDEFYQKVRFLGWHGRLRNRKCKDQQGSTECAAKKKKGKLVVQAIHDAQKVKVDLQVDAPVVVGRAMNTGGVEDDLLPIAPARPGYPPDQYYFIVERGTSTQAKLTVAQLQLTQDGSKAEAFIPHVAKKGFVHCNHNDPGRTQGVADFRACTRSPSPSDSGLRPQDFRDPAIEMAWFSCDAGCCSAQWPPSMPFVSKSKDSLAERRAKR